ncbi:hypothetical protein [Salinisphaera sp.]|uniref:ArnT family glycosyltransferase n=1 Tax=Salinisphaera sp. TaxID=1914330 RepID=UPI002D769BEA|nr:hypothetical protein [Salinisphaera sp.]HET7313356.1 hypothetical protein [Salinisphaera sp.]
MWIAVAFGAYARLRGLGTWPWAEDEYFVAQSVENILRHGIPAFDCGGYYMRGLTLQYLIAPLFALGIKPEFAARLVPVAFSFALLPAVYLLGKRLSGVTVACVSVGLLSISLWEIEFARFARMYVPFQAVFLWYLLALHRVVVDGRSTAYGWLWLLSVLGVFTWAGGFFLLVVNFLPSLIERAPGRVRHLAVSAGLLLLGYWYSSLNFRFMGDQPPLPPDVPVEVDGSSFIIPPLLAPTLPSHPAWIIGALAILLVSLAAAFQLARISPTARNGFAWLVLIALSLLNLFGCVLIGLILAVLLGWIDIRRISRRVMLIALPPIAVNFLFWLAYAFFTDDWYRLFPGFGPGGELSKLAVVLFKYPNVFDQILDPWLTAIPALTVALAGLIALAGCRAVWCRDESQYMISLRLMLTVALIMMALVGVVETKYVETRYTFFLLPLFYLVAITAVYTLLARSIRSRPKRGLALGAALLALVVTTEDFGWAHLIHIDTANWNYRLSLNQALSDHYYPRWDYRSPAQYVNQRAHANDVIIVASQAVAYYLKRTDYVYWDFRWGEFASFSCNKGQQERWSGSRLLYRLKDLSKVIRQAQGNVWLIVKLSWAYPKTKEFSRQYSEQLVYRGRAGHLGVYKISGSR